MDHEAFEKEMIDHVNRNAEEKHPKEPVITKTDKHAITRGLKHVLLSLITVAMFAASVSGFYVTAIVPGYLAVAAFIASIAASVATVILLYAHGSACMRGKGDAK